MKTPMIYSEWVDILNILKNRTNDEEVLEVKKKGTIEWQSGVAERLTKRLINIVNERMQYAIDKYQSVKYYDGSRSPIEVSKEKNGYSLAWLHHKSRNKHHYFYWIDQYQEEGGIGLQMPYKYAVEMFCDMVAASKCYKRDKFTNDAPLNYFKTQNYGHFMHEGMKKFLSICFNNYAELGESEEWFNKEMMHIIYDSCFGGI